MTQYCSIDDVAKVLKQYSQAFKNITESTTAEVNEAINEATSCVKQLLSYRYNIATIDADIPRVVKDYVKVKAAIICLINWQSIGDAKNVEQTISILHKRVEYYASDIVNGNILNSNDVIIDNTTIGDIITPSES